MNQRAADTDQSDRTSASPEPLRGDPGRDIAALVLSILSFVLLPVVGALIALALVGRSWRGSNSPMGNAARIISTVNLYLCAFALGVLGLLAGKDALDRHAEESFEEIGEAIGAEGESGSATTLALSTERDTSPIESGQSFYDLCNQSPVGQMETYFLLENHGVIHPDPTRMVSALFDDGAAVAYTHDGVHALFWWQSPGVIWAQNGNALIWSPAVRPPSPPSVGVLTLLEGCLDE